MNKRILFVFRHAPYGSALAREGLDALLAAAVYDQDIAVLFLNDGVLQLITGQDTAAANAKNHERMLSALPIYGIEQVFVHDASLSARGLADSELVLSPKRLSDAQVSELMHSCDQLLSF